MASYVLNEAKMFSDIADGIAIVINSETGIYYGMNGFGTQVFGSLMDDASAESIVTALKALPDTPDDMEIRFNAFVDELKNFEIILEGGNGTGAVNIDANTAKTDEFSLTVQEFNDAQELLLADPIHEVKEDSGWQPDKISLETNKDIIAAKEAKMQQ